MSDFIGCIYDGAPDTLSQLDAALAVSGGVLVSSAVPIAARHIIRPLSSWLAFDVDHRHPHRGAGAAVADANNNDKNINKRKKSLHLFKFSTHTIGSGAKAHVQRYRPQMLLMDFMVVPVTRSFFSEHTEQQPNHLLQELLNVISLAGTHRQAMMGVGVVAPLQVIFQFDGTTAPASLPEQLEKVFQKFRHFARYSIAPPLLAAAEAGGAAPLIDMLRGLASASSAEAAATTFVDPASTTATACRPSSFFQCHVLGCTSPPARISEVRACIGRAAADATVVIGETIVTHNVSNMGASYIVHTVRSDLPSVKTSLYDALVKPGAAPDIDDWEAASGDSQTSDSALMMKKKTVSVKKGDLVYLLLGQPQLFSRLDGSTLPCFVETPFLPQNKQCAMRPVSFCDIRCPDVRSQLLMPRFLFVHGPKCKALQDLGREVTVIGLHSSPARVVHFDKETNRCVLACFHRKDEALFVPEIGCHADNDDKNEQAEGAATDTTPRSCNNSTPARLAVLIRSSHDPIGTVVAVHGALRATELAHGLLDALLASQRQESNNTHVMQSLLSRLCRQSFCPKWDLADASTHTAWASAHQVFLHELLATDLTALFAFSRRGDVRAVCRPHAGLSLTDVEDCGIVMRSFISLASSLADKAALRSCCSTIADRFTNNLNPTQIAGKTVKRIFDTQCAQRRREFSFFPEPLCSLASSHGSEKLDLFLSCFIGHCCTNETSFFDEMKVPGLFPKEPPSLDEQALRAMAAARCGHFMHRSNEEKTAGIAVAVPPLLQETHAGVVKPRGHYTALAALHAAPQIVTRASLAVRMVGSAACFGGTYPAAGINFDGFLRATQNTSILKQKVVDFRDNHPAVMHDFIVNHARRWSGFLERSLQVSLSANCVMFYAELQQLVAARQCTGIDETTMSREPVLRISPAIWHNIFSFVSPRLQW